MRSLSPPLQPIPGSDRTLHFHYKGNAGALGQALFFCLIAAGFAAAHLPAIAWLNLGLACLLATGALANALIEWELNLDAAGGRYQVRRDLHPFRRHITGAIDDFEKIHVAPGHDWTHVFLVPKGSRRGYDLHRHLDREAARKVGQDLASQLGLRLEVEEYVEPQIPETDLGRVPDACAIRSTAIPGGIDLDLTPRPRLWRHWLRVTDKGLESGVDFCAPWGRRYPSSTVVHWADINQVLQGHNSSASESGSSSSWRFKRHWREDLAAQWQDHCAELKRAATAPPFWGLLWYLKEGDYREYDQCVEIYRKKGGRLEVGSSFELGRLGVDWLYAGIVTFGQKRGARFSTSS